MVYKIEGKTATVEIDYEGQKGEVKLKKLKFKEWAYSLDEFLEYTQGKGTKVKIGQMLLSTLPKSIISAPFPHKTNTEIHEAEITLDDIMEIQNALMDLNGMGGKSTKKEINPESTS